MQVVDASKNTEPEREKGRLHRCAPVKARHVWINMLQKSDNPAVHLVEARIFEAGK